MSELESLRQQALAIGVELAIALYGETPHPAQRGRYDREVAEATAIIDAFEAAAKREGVSEARRLPWRCNGGHDHILALWDCPDPSHRERAIAEASAAVAEVARLRRWFECAPTFVTTGMMGVVSVSQAALRGDSADDFPPLPTPPDALDAVKREGVREWIEGLAPDSAVGIAQFIDKATPRPATLSECGALMQQALLNALAKEGENA